MTGVREKIKSIVEKFKAETSLYADDDVLYEGDSDHHHIIIREEGGRRTLYFGPLGEEAETSIDVFNPDRAVFEYPGMMLAALAVFPAGKRVAMIGLGGGFLPRLFSLHLPQYRLTVVEVDLMVVELAQTYFGFSPGPNVDLVVADGRDFIEGAAPESIDQIWLDAFSGDYVPPRLSGLNFLKLCQSRLAPGGLVVQNLHQNRPDLFQRQLRTTAEALGPFLAFDGRLCGNAIIISQKPGGPPGPPWTRDGLIKAAKSFGPRLGPYDLAAEMKKLKTFVPDPSAEIME